MSSRMILGAALALMSLAFATSCTHEAKKKYPGGDSSKDLAASGKSSFTIVEFPQGKSKLNQEEKSVAKKISQEKRSIKSIRVLAWSDKSSQGTRKKALPKDIILANERAVAVRDYLEKNIKDRREIVAINMARDFESTDTKTSKAIVIIDYRPQ